MIEILHCKYKYNKKYIVKISTFKHIKTGVYIYIEADIDKV